jgi:hypothetical protein
MAVASQRTVPPQPTRQPSASTRLHALVTLGIFLLALVVLGVEASGSPFEADEADYVATSRYFGYLVLQRDVTRKEWGSNHWTRTQPPLTRYIVGAWLTAWGYDLETLNQPYVSTASSYEINRQKGRVPTDDVLSRSRQPMVLLGAGAIALLYPLGLVIGRPLGGPIAGVAAALLALSSPFIRYTLIHTWAEASLAFFLLLAALLAAVGIERALHRRPGLWRWAVGLGLALGLASATKLTGLVGLLAVAVVATSAALWSWRQRGDLALGRTVLTWAALAAGVALVVFVVVNPYLWRDPVGGFAGMLEERRDEMAFQQDQWPEYAVRGWAERPWLTVNGSLQVGPLAETPLAVLVNLPLLIVGLAGLVRQWRQGRLSLAATSVLAWAAVYTIVIVAGLGLKYPRYFMPSTLLLLPIVGLGLAIVVRAVWERLPLTAGRASADPRPS